MPDGKKLDCRQCPGFCCKMAGRVEVSPTDIRRLGKHLGLSPAQFEQKHVVRDSPRSKKCIKLAFETCQFLGPNHACKVYEARPYDCRHYVCWNQDDKTVYEFASLAQLSAQTVRRLERAAKDK